MRDPILTEAKLRLRQRHRALYNLLRNRQSRLYQLRSLLGRSGAIKAYLELHPIRKLHIGSGPHRLSGWFNTDIDPRWPGVSFLDATKRFPFPGSLFDYIYSEHLIEHLTYHEGVSFLRECRRVLKRGGRIRIATPNLAMITGLCEKEKTDEQRKFIAWYQSSFGWGTTMSGECLAVNSCFRRFGHKFIYDQATLQDSMEQAGLLDCSSYPVGESSDQHLHGLEFHGEGFDNKEVIQFETMAIEARRP